MRIAGIAALALAISIAAGCGGGTQAPGASTSPASEPPAGERLLVSCSDIPFDAAGLRDGGGQPPETHPAGALLGALLTRGGPEGLDRLPRAGWRLVAATPDDAMFVAPSGDAWAFVAIRLTEAAWKLDTWGECVPSAFVEGRNIAEWQFDPAMPLPGPDDTTFVALVTERACASGRPMGDRLQAPQITYGETDIVVVFSALPQPGGQDCQGNPPSRVEVRLREPVGQRQLLDGSVFPPADPAQPRF